MRFRATKGTESKLVRKGWETVQQSIYRVRRLGTWIMKSRVDAEVREYERNAREKRIGVDGRANFGMATR